MKKKNRVDKENYSHAFKLQIVEEIDNGLISRHGASVKYEISRSSIDYWWKKYSKLIKSLWQNDTATILSMRTSD